MAVKINRRSMRDEKVTVMLSPEEFVAMSDHCRDDLKRKAHSAFFRDLFLEYMARLEEKKKEREATLSALAKLLDTTNHAQILNSLNGLLEGKKE